MPFRLPRSAEEAQLSGGAHVLTPDSAWMGESNWNGAYVLSEAAATVRFELDAEQRAVIDTDGATAHPFVHRLAEETGAARWSALDVDRTSSARSTWAAPAVRA